MEPLVGTIPCTRLVHRENDLVRLSVYAKQIDDGGIGNAGLKIFLLLIPRHWPRIVAHHGSRATALSSPCHLCLRTIHSGAHSEQQLLGRRQSGVQYLRRPDRPRRRAATLRGPAYSRPRSVRFETTREIGQTEPARRDSRFEIKPSP